MNSENTCDHEWFTIHPPDSEGWMKETCSNEQCGVTLGWGRLGQFLDGDASTHETEIGDKMHYYTLLPTNIAHGDTVANPPDCALSVFKDPRSISVTDTLDLFDKDDDIERVLDPSLFTLVQVAPLGPTQPAWLNGGDAEVLCDDGWRIEQRVSTDLLLGPEPQRIRDAVFTETNEDAYLDVVDAGPDLDHGVQAAGAALTAHGVDGAWWMNQVGCTRGYELIALAASDLIGTQPDWTKRAHDDLMRPWNGTVGWSSAAAAR